MTFEFEHVQPPIQTVAIVWGCLILTGWGEGGKTLEGLTATGRATIATLYMNHLALVRARAMWVALGEHPPENLAR